MLPRQLDFFLLSCVCIRDNFKTRLKITYISRDNLSRNSAAGVSFLSVNLTTNQQDTVSSINDACVSSKALGGGGEKGNSTFCSEE